MKTLTKDEEFVLDKIKLFIKANVFSPTVRELCFLTGECSPATIHYHLKNLKEKGYINYIDGKNRTIIVKKVRKK